MSNETEHDIIAVSSKHRRVPPELDKTKPRNVFWTSGWDSTFRVVELLLAGYKVQPWYVVSDVSPRPSARIELETMRKIRKRLAEDYPETEELLLPLRIVRESTLQPRPDLGAAMRRLRKKKGILADQYMFLAGLLDQLKIKMEVGFVKEGSGSRNLGEDIVFDEASGESSVRSDADPDVKALFGSMTFPLIDISKPEMGEVATELCFDQIMEMTWFCSTPLFGRPCGYCGPCSATRELGMGRRVPSGRRGPRYLAFKTAWWRARNPNRTIAKNLKLKAYHALKGSQRRVAEVLKRNR